MFRFEMCCCTGVVLHLLHIRQSYSEILKILILIYSEITEISSFQIFERDNPVAPNSRCPYLLRIEATFRCFVFFTPLLLLLWFQQDENCLVFCLPRYLNKIILKSITENNNIHSLVELMKLYDCHHFISDAVC